MSKDPVPSHPHYLHALDGLRFFAAIFVAIAHLSVSVFKIAPSPDIIPYITSLAGIGMTLFFVLSGFVIHYNYHTGPEGWSKKSLRYFIIARFSRLYPLFFAVVLYDVLRASQQFPANFDRAWMALPLYLSMTHSWIYAVIGENALIYQFAYYSAVSWSISVEIFLYLAYLPLALWLVRVQRVRTMLIAGAALYGIYYLGTLIFGQYYGQINTWGIEHYGPIADVNKGHQDSFVRWVIYFSPYTRLMEFLLGCFAAKLILHYRNTPPRLGRHAASLLSFAAAAAVIGVHCWFYHFNGTSNHAKSQLYAPLVALLIFMVARYASPLQRFLGSKALCRGGDASYSIYLLHFLVIRYFAQPNVSSDMGLDGILALKAIVMLVLIIAFSRLVYLGFEFPAKELIRRRMHLRSLPRYLVSMLWKSRLVVLVVVATYNLLLYYDKLLLTHLGYI